MDFFKLAVNLARAQAKGIKHEDDGILSCKHHPDNGGDCRFHKLPGNCDSCHEHGFSLVVLQGELQARRHGRQGDKDGERQAIGGFGDDMCHLADATRWAREKARLKALKSNCAGNWPVNNGSLDGQRARQETKTGGRDH